MQKAVGARCDDPILWHSTPELSRCLCLLMSENFLTKFNFNNDHRKRTLFTVECHSCVNITPFSAIPAEDEVLLMPGTVMGVLGASCNCIYFNQAA